MRASDGDDGGGDDNDDNDDSDDDDGRARLRQALARVANSPFFLPPDRPAPASPTGSPSSPSSVSSSFYVDASPASPSRQRPGGADAGGGVGSDGGKVVKQGRRQGTTRQHTLTRDL